MTGPFLQVSYGEDKAALDAARDYASASGHVICDALSGQHDPHEVATLALRADMVVHVFWPSSNLPRAWRNYADRVIEHVPGDGFRVVKHRAA